VALFLLSLRPLKVKFAPPPPVQHPEITLLAGKFLFSCEFAIFNHSKRFQVPRLGLLPSGSDVWTSRHPGTDSSVRRLCAWSEDGILSRFGAVFPQPCLKEAALSPLPCRLPALLIEGLLIFLGPFSPPP